MYELTHTTEYDEVSLLIEQDQETLCEVLATLETAIAIDAERFPASRRYQQLRIARSLTYVDRDGVLLPPLRIVFQITDWNKVALLFLRITDFFTEEDE